MSVLARYHPAGAVIQTERYPELRHRLGREEFRQAAAIAREEGLWRLDS